MRKLFILALLPTLGTTTPPADTRAVDVAKVRGRIQYVDAFPDYKVESGQRPRMGLEPGITPALVLWDSVARRPIPIGYGVLSADELQDRIYLLTSKEAGHDY